MSTRKHQVSTRTSARRWLLAALMALTVPAYAADAVSDLLRSARIWQVKGRSDLARVALNKALAIRPTDAECLLQLGLLEVEANKFDEAKQALTRLNNAHPNDVRRRELEESIRVNGSDRLKLATVRRLMQSSRTLNEGVRGMRELFPDGPPPGQLGIDYYRAISREDGHWDEGRLGLERLAQQNSDEPEYQYALARTWLGRERTRDAAFRLMRQLLQRQDFNSRRVLDLWRGEVLDAPKDAYMLARAREYLQLAPDDTVLAAKLAGVQVAVEPAPSTAVPEVPSTKPSKPSAASVAVAQARTDALPNKPETARNNDPKPRNPSANLGTKKPVVVQAATGVLRRLAESPVLIVPQGAVVTELSAELPQTRYVLPRDEALAELWLQTAAKERQDGQAEIANQIEIAADGLIDGNFYKASQAALQIASAGRVADAETVLRSLLTLEPNNENATAALVRIWVNSGRESEAIAFIQQARAADLARAPVLDRLLAELYRDQAAQALAQNQRTSAQGLLETALQLAPQDAWIRYRLASFYAEDMQLDRARKTAQQGPALAPDDPEQHFANALLLSKLDAPLDALAALDYIPSASRSESVQRLDARLKMDYQRYQALHLLAAGDQGNAFGAAQNAQKIAESDNNLLAAAAELWTAVGAPERGLALLRGRILATPELAPRVELALQLNQRNSDAELQPLLSELRARPDLNAEQRRQMTEIESESSLRQAARLRADGRVDDAQSLLQTQALQIASPELLLAAGALAEARGQYNQARGLYRQARSLENPTTADAQSPAFRQIQALEQRPEPRVTVGFDAIDRSGAAGVSSLHGQQMPVEIRWPERLETDVLVRVDPIRISSGTLPSDYDEAALFGAVQAVGPVAYANSRRPRRQSEQGVALGVIYDGSNLRADIGITPMGFLRQDWVGGLRYQNSVVGLDYRLEVARRPMTGSVVSYAGAQDPISGQVWGAVRKNGAVVALSKTVDDLEIFGSAGYARFTGRNVKDNRQHFLRAGLDWRAFESRVATVFAGFTLGYQGHDNNQRYYTFGHGGYYSPQSSVTAAIPVDVRGGIGKLSYQLRASGNYTKTRESAANFYPNSAALQAAARNSVLPAGFSAPVYDGSSSAGFGYSLSLGLEYLLLRQWVVGTRFSLDRADFYEPNAYQLYLRYGFNPKDPVLEIAPLPIKPYSDF